MAKNRPFKNKVDRVRRAQMQRNLVIYGAVAVVAAVVLLIAYGAAYETLIKPEQPILTIEGEEILTREFATRARFDRWQLVNQYVQFALNQQLFASNPGFASQVQQTLQSIEFQLQPAIVGRSTLDQIINEYLISEEAARRGITVSQAELDESLAELFGYYEEGTPTPTATLALTPTSTLSALQQTFVTVVPTTTSTPPGTSAAPPTQTAAADTSGDTDEEDAVESEEGDPAATATTGLPTLTPTVITEDIYLETFDSVVSQLESEIDFSEQDYRELIRAQLLADKLFADMTGDVPFEADQVWVRHIVLAEESEALAALERAESGEDWSELAAELSTDSPTAGRGGDLGWINADLRFGEFNDAFFEAAFAAEIGDVAGPVETEQGWHIIQVLGHEVRQYTPEERSQIQTSIFQDWLAQAVEETDIVIAEDWVDRVPREPEIPPQLRIQPAADQQNPLISP